MAEPVLEQKTAEVQTAARVPESQSIVDQIKQKPALIAAIVVPVVVVLVVAGVLIWYFVTHKNNSGGGGGGGGGDVTPTAPVFEGYTAATPVWCPSQYRVRVSSSGIWSSWSGDTGTPVGNLAGEPAFSMAWAAGLTDAQRSSLQWQRRLTGTTNSSTATMQAVAGSVIEFKDTGSSPCSGGGGGPGPGGAAIPEVLPFTRTGEFYWARSVRYRARFAVSGPGDWSGWSTPVLSNFQEKGIGPVLRVSNAPAGTDVVFQQELAPLSGETEPTVENIEGARAPARIGSTNTFAVDTVPPARYLQVSNGIERDGVPQGRTFIINRNNQQIYQLTLTAAEAGVWGLEDLLARISAGFGTIGLLFTPVEGTVCLRAHLAANSTINGGAGAEIRFLPYASSSSNVAFWPNAWNGVVTLNRMLGFGPILDAASNGTGSPVVSGLVGQVGYWGVEFIGRHS